MDDIDDLGEIREHMGGGGGGGADGEDRNNTSGESADCSQQEGEARRKLLPHTTSVGENVLSQFGIGSSSRSLPDVVDPSFRPPATSINSQQTLGELLTSVANGDQPIAATQSFHLNPLSTSTKDTKTNLIRDYGIDIFGSNYTSSSTTPTTSLSSTSIATSSFTENTAAAAFAPFNNLIYDDDYPLNSMSTGFPEQSSTYNMNPSTTTTTATNSAYQSNNSTATTIRNQLLAPSGIFSDTAFKVTSDKPMSFSSLAQKNISSSDSSCQNILKGNVMTNTLLEYGPPTSSWPPPLPSVNTPYRDPSRPSRPNPMGPTPIGADKGATPHSDLSPAQQRANSQNPMKINLPKTSHTLTSGSSIAPPKPGGPLYSPPRSPPLDTIESLVSGPNFSASGGENASKETSTALEIVPVASTSGKSSPHQKKFDNLDMLALIEKSREYESRYKADLRRRNDIETYLNDLTRKQHGRNVELTPNFRKSKDEQIECQKSIDNNKKLMDTINEKLNSKYNIKMASRSEQHPNKIQRAKMSTGGGSAQVGEKLNQREQRYRNSLLHLREKEMYCAKCDIHFDSMKQYCEHLHTKSYNHAAKAAPWRTQKELFTIEKTHDSFKSICALISNDRGENFSLQHIDNILNPTLENKESALKVRTRERDRKCFSQDDPLFYVKGYDHLIPITGFYCNLCGSLHCDDVEAKQHVMSYEHASKHMKLMFMHPQHEINFRRKLGKSSKLNQQAESTNRAPSKPANQPSTSNQYKKSTSRIVDEHEVLADKFPKRLLPQPDKQIVPQATSSTHKRRSSPEEEDDDGEDIRLLKRAAHEPEKQNRRFPTTELMPLGDKSRTKPSALKRLRNDKLQTAPQPLPRPQPPPETATAAPTTTATEIPLVHFDSSSSDNGSVDNIPSCRYENDEVHLSKGDPDSPFPELDLRVSGRAHMNTLKDNRLAGTFTVKLERLNIDDYQHMLMDSTTLWTRVSAMMTKKEPETIRKELFDKRSTRPVYFHLDDANVAIDIENDDQEDEDVKPFDILRSKSANSNEREEMDIEGLTDKIIFPDSDSDHADSNEWHDQQKIDLDSLNDFFWE